MSSKNGRKQAEYGKMSSIPNSFFCTVLLFQAAYLNIPEEEAFPTSPC